ncbi:MAG: thiamine phosphate synthase [bacterium]|nr:thiamine phosphate synthase [bacterium]
MDLPGLYLISDSNQTRGRPLLKALELALEGGASLIQLREKELPTRELFELACRLRQLTGRFGAKLLINDRIDIAIAVDADGVHLPAASFGSMDSRKLIGRDKIVGLSAHSSQDAIIAEREGADFVTFSPIYYTPSKADYGEPQGLESLEEVCSKVNIPVYGLGGIRLENVRDVMGRGASGVAMISAILGAKDIKAETLKLLKSLNEV